MSRVAKFRGLACYHLGCQDDITELERLIKRNILVKGGIAFKRQHIRGLIYAAPLMIETVHLLFVDKGKGYLDLAGDSLRLENKMNDVFDLGSIEQLLELCIVTDEHAHEHSPFRVARPRRRVFCS